MPVVLRTVAFDHPAASALMQQMEAELSARYGDGGVSPATAGDFDLPGAFLLADRDGAPVGCGGLRLVQPGVGELKRMFVAPAGRRRGIGRTVLRGLLAHAEEQGLTRVLLETGTEQPEAMSLYAAEGFHPVAAYGHYAQDPRTRCFARELDR